MSNVRLDVIQQDYLQSWLLEAFCRREIRSSFVFKGGTALKKCYFGDYRFSEDLDFTAKQSAPEGLQLEKALREVCVTAEDLMNEVANIKLSFQRYREKVPHPHRQEAFVIRAQYPWQNEPLTKVMLEMTFAEKIVTKPVEKQLLHPYGEKLDSYIEVYSLEEIIIEKLRALLQNAKKIHEQGWARSRVRDYYDLHHITKSYSKGISWEAINTYLQEKCSQKDVAFNVVDDFFDPKVIDDAQRNWEKWLDHLAPNTIGFDDTIQGLKTLMETKLFQDK